MGRDHTRVCRQRRRAPGAQLSLVVLDHGRRSRCAARHRSMTSRLLWEMDERARGQEVVEADDLAVEDAVA